MTDEIKTSNQNLYFETEFYRHYRTATQEECEKGREIAKRIQLLKKLRTELLTEKKVDPSFVFPSDLWQKTINFFCSYCNEPSNEMIDTWRLHTFHFSGTYPGAWISNPQQPTLSNRDIARYVHHTLGLPDDLIVRPPNMMAELGWWYNGGTVNPDTLLTQIYIQQLYYAGAINYLKKKPIRILEIGGGYGRLAWTLDKMLNPMSYTMCDLVEPLLFPAVYIGLAKPETKIDSVYDGTKDIQQKGFSFIPNFLLESLVGKIKFDFIINTSSLCEMTVAQIEKYSELIEKLMADGGIFFESNYKQAVTSTLDSSLSKRFSHIKMIGSKRLWFKDPSVLDDIKMVKPKDTRNKAKLIKGVISALGIKNALRLMRGKEWIKLLLNRY